MRSFKNVNDNLIYWSVFIGAVFMVSSYIVNFANAVTAEQEAVLYNIDKAELIFNGETAYTGASTGLDVSLINNDKKVKNMVSIDTNYGIIKVELFLDKAPITAGNFKKLALEGFYDGTRFHRVIPGFMIQGGDPLSKDKNFITRWGTGGPGYAIADEFGKGLSNIRGTLSMANSGPNTGGSQFFINLTDNSFLDWDKEPLTSRHAVFGKVVEGMDIVDKISKTKTTGSPFDRPAEDVLIKSIIVE